jgi:hypothetical protein
MANCEFRQDSVTVDGRANIRLAISAYTPICLVKVYNSSTYPACELPTASAESCPIAQFEKGQITFEQTNQQLTDIFDARRASNGE